MFTTVQQFMNEHTHHDYERSRPVKSPSEHSEHPNPSHSLHGFAVASWASLTATAVVVGVHHVYREGWQLLVPFAILAALPYPLLRWFRATGSRASLWAYGLLSAVTIGGFGFVDGFLDHVTNALVGLYTAASGQEADRVERAFRVLP